MFLAQWGMFMSVSAFLRVSWVNVCVCVCMWVSAYVGALVWERF